MRYKSMRYKILYI